MKGYACTVKVERVRSDASLPVYATAGAAGADLAAAIDRDIVIAPGERHLIPTGLRIELPTGFEGQVRPRSGTAVRNGVTVLNAPGTIDEDYRGEVRVVLINLGDVPFTVKHGDRIAQLVVAPVSRAAFTETGELSDSERSTGGFGSTGV